MTYTLPPLPYAYDALEPHIDKATMEFHHDKHHQAYVDKLNAAIEGNSDLLAASIEELLRDISKVSEAKRSAVKNNGGGHYNHTMFWENMSPDGGGEPSGELARAIDAAFGSFGELKSRMKEAGVNQFGSGWAWLVHDGADLAVLATANQDSPLSFGQVPLLGLDVWEHSYYLKYQNRRPDYIDAWWNVVDLDRVAERFAAAAEQAPPAAASASGEFSILTTAG
jgi:Fe-Mn family superoxide dismutase